MDNNGIVCIVINPCNMVFEENCTQTIYGQISDCHSKMTYPEEVMEVMAQAIKSGIDNAQKVVTEQANHEYSMDAMARTVPLFGSMYGWLLPDHVDDDDVDNETGVGYQIGVGIVKPTIQRPSQMIHAEEVNEEQEEEEDEEEAEVINVD